MGEGNGMGREMKFSALSSVARYIRTAGAENNEKDVACHATISIGSNRFLLGSLVDWNK